MNNDIEMELAYYKYLIVLAVVLGQCEELVKRDEYEDMVLSLRLL
jgi:hypothetical protein